MNSPRVSLGYFFPRISLRINHNGKSIYGSHRGKREKAHGRESNSTNALTCCVVMTGADLRLAVISDSHGRLIAPPNSSFPQ
ncbi:hypothetical protein C9196_23205 [Escherichia coli]|nr:hypothetical protein C9196_23205 [Escherichia coli]